jgi:hypothetical protein
VKKKRFSVEQIAAVLRQAEQGVPVAFDIAVGRGLTGQDVVATLERLRFDRGLP